MVAARKLDSPDCIPVPWLTEPPRPQPSPPTLTEIYETNFRSRLDAVAPKTREAYRDAIKHWRRYTGDPPATEITPDLLRTFQLKLKRRQRKGETISTSTVDKIFRHLRPLVNLCMPRDRLNPEGLGLIDYVKFPAPLTKAEGKPKRFRLDEIERLYRACDIATWPRRQPVPAPVQWRCAIVCFYNLGPRVYDLFQRTWKDVTWDWEEDLHPYGGIEFVATKTKKFQRIPFNAVVQAHLRSMLVGPARGPIFRGCWQDTNRKTINGQWAAIVQAAGITPHKPLITLRHTCNTALNRITPGVGHWVLGHRTSAGDVNASNYYDPTDTVFEAVLALPQAPSFLSALTSDLGTRQPHLAR